MAIVRGKWYKIVTWNRTYHVRVGFYKIPDFSGEGIYYEEDDKNDDKKSPWGWHPISWITIKSVTEISPLNKEDH